MIIFAFEEHPSISNPSLHVLLGAGKSTLTNILSCEMAQSSGEVVIFGRSVALDTDDIRCMVSICKQDDFLWPNLTAKEHLEIFAGLRGVDSDSRSLTVQRWLESVDLTVQQHMFSSAFSGGMKRRLSVALSTIGERPFIIFDEPTTGMVRRNHKFNRALWFSIVQKLNFVPFHSIKL